MNTFYGVRVALWAQEPMDLSKVEETLARLGCGVEWASTDNQIRALVQESGIDLVVVRLHPGWQAPLEFLRWLRGVESPPAVLVAGGRLDVPLYLEAMREGALDAVALPPNEKELVRVVTQALEHISFRNGVAFAQ